MESGNVEKRESGRIVDRRRNVEMEWWINEEGWDSCESGNVEGKGKWWKRIQRMVEKWRRLRLRKVEMWRWKHGKDKNGRDESVDKVELRKGWEEGKKNKGER